MNPLESGHKAIPNTQTTPTTQYTNHAKKEPKNQLYTIYIIHTCTFIHTYIRYNTQTKAKSSNIVYTSYVTSNLIMYVGMYVQVTKKEK
ncbi:hypothetical protein BDV36DRAFT_270306 [Aspergillus pseudocaelatus]|uniref:Uncharacterized protein n=1 Tax=Aspergillus pseudocaelatus TaxID=1825620 RepID=A0ABQ6W6L3_9EURO|nr:hypothetical protein BDV36DRAFT_270306 [Aspergillus pseudocaelatus]